MSELNGKCMCGAVSVTATPAKPELGACHCGMCRAWSSAAFVGFVVQPGYASLGPVKTYRSSDWAERTFCSECGTSLWYRVTAPGDHHGETHMSAGLFENAGGAALTHEVFIDRKPEGYAFAGKTHQMTEAEIFAMFGGDGE